MLKNGLEYLFICFSASLLFCELKNNGMQPDNSKIFFGKSNALQTENSKKKAQFIAETDAQKVAQEKLLLQQTYTRCLDANLKELERAGQKIRELLPKLDTHGNEKLYTDHIKRYRESLCIAAGDQETLFSLALDSWASKGAFFSSRLVSSSEFAYGNNLHKAIKSAYGMKTASESWSLIVDYREIEKIIIEQMAKKEKQEKESQTIEDNKVISQSFSRESQTEIIQNPENISTAKKVSWPHKHPFIFASGAVYLTLFLLGLTIEQ